MNLIEYVIRIKMKDKALPIQDVVIENELDEICEREHSHCNSNCPIYKYSKLEINCKYHKDGKGMLKLLRRRYKQEQGQ